TSAEPASPPGSLQAQGDVGDHAAVHCKEGAYPALGHAGVAESTGQGEVREDDPRSARDEQGIRTGQAVVDDPAEKEGSGDAKEQIAAQVQAECGPQGQRDAPGR